MAENNEPRENWILGRARAAYRLVTQPTGRLRGGKRGLVTIVGVVVLLLFLAGLAVALGLLGSGVTVTAASRPASCAGCHEIRPLYEEWQASSHKDVNCLNCHTEPGFAGYMKSNFSAVANIWAQITGDYEFHADSVVKDESCLRCHPRSQLPETLPQATLKVNHKSHENLTCSECHTRIVHARQFDPNTKAAAATHAEKNCQVCHPSPNPTYLHGESGVACNSCHSATIPNHDLSRKRGEMPREDCVDCHERKRVSAATSCQTCHVSPHGVPTDTPETNCSKCHSSQETWTEKSFAHPVKLEGKHAQLQCSKCHTNGKDFRGLKFSCQNCHKPGHEPFADNNCATCHKPTGWKPISVDHTVLWSGFVDKHAAATCNQCHTAGKYKGTSKDCSSCHTTPKSMVGTDCVLCHKPGSRWK